MPGGGLVVSDVVIDVPKDQQPPVLLAALIRVAISAAAFQVLVMAGLPAVQTPKGIARRTWGLMVLSGFMGMGLGMTFLVWAQSFAGAQVSLISALSQTTPVWTLLLLWAITGERPAALAFVGAGAAVTGVFLITLT